MIASAHDIDLPIVGMSCATCAGRVERSLARQRGVVSVSVNFATEQGRVRVGSDGAGLEALVAAVAAAGYEVPTRVLDLAVSGMSCASCVARVERALQTVPGVVTAAANLATERVRAVVLVATRPEALGSALRSAGYDVVPTAESVPATQQDGAPLLPADQTGTAAGRDPGQRGRRASDVLTWLAARREGLRVILALLLSTPLLLGMVAHASGGRWMVPGWGQFLLTLPVQVWLGARLHRGAWRALRAGVGSMDLLVSLGSFAAFLLSCWTLVRGASMSAAPVARTGAGASGIAGHGLAATAAAGHMFGSSGGALYFESSALIITFVLLGKWLERHARRQSASALRALADLRPNVVRMLRDDRETEMPLEAVRIGDRIAVWPGERIAVDGQVTDGAGAVDESMITGESLPVDKCAGDAVTGGTLNHDGRLIVQVSATGVDTVLSRIIRTVETAQATKPRVQGLVDRVSAIFVPVIVALAALTFAGWMVCGADVGTAMLNAVAVLVIACPCALGLAAPVAMVVGTGVAARFGILIADAETVSRAPAIRVVAFDKTGTLTTGRPVIEALSPAQGVDAAELLRVAYSLSTASAHPVAAAIRIRAEADGLALLPTRDLRVLAGRGVAGVLAGRRHVLGSRRLLHEHGVSPAPLEEQAGVLEQQGCTVSWIAELDTEPTIPAAPEPIAAMPTGSRTPARPGTGDAGIVLAERVDSQTGHRAAGPGLGDRQAHQGRLLGLVGLADTVRPGSSRAVARLHARGIRTVMLTGDNDGAGRKVAMSLGIRQVQAALLPEGKAAALAVLRASGAVAMVGDGINDAPALAAADLGIAMGNGSDVALHSAGIALMRADPSLVVDALDIASRTQRKVHQGLVWALAYNLVGLPLAASGELSPAIAGAAMALSSLGVVSNALLLKFWRPSA